MVSRTAIFAILFLALALLSSSGSAAQATEEEEAIAAKLPKNCDSQKEPKEFKISRKGAPPAAREIAESYGPLKGDLAEIIAGAPGVDLAFDTGLCGERDYEGECSGVKVEVTEYLLCNQPIEVQVVSHEPLNPVPEVNDRDVTGAVYAISGEPPLEIASPAEIARLMEIIRSRSRSNVAEIASRPLKLKDGSIVQSRSHKLFAQAVGDDGLRITLRGGGTMVFSGHARTGEFERFYNEELYPFLAGLARARGLPPPSR